MSDQNVLLISKLFKKVNIEVQSSGSKRYRIDISFASLQISEITWKLLTFDGLKLHVLQGFLVNQVIFLLRRQIKSSESSVFQPFPIIGPQFHPTAR